MILVIAEQRDGKLNRASWETVAAAQQAGGAIKIAVAGSSIEGLASELAAAEVNEVLAIEAAALEPYTPDGFTLALADVLAAESPERVFFPHTYQTRDFAPKLAARLDRPLVTDVVAVKPRDGGPAYVRPVFQGKLAADVVAE
jgi:electron transfer flavoprotein alpha subunit